MKIIRKWRMEGCQKWRRRHATSSGDGVRWGCGCWELWSVLEKRKKIKIKNKKNGAMRVGVASDNVWEGLLWNVCLRGGGGEGRKKNK